MLAFAVLINLVVAAGLIVMGTKYCTAKPPLDYHSEILSGAPLSNELKLIFGGLYKGMGGAILVSGAGSIAATAARGVELATQVKTPWRIAAGLMAIAVLAFLISLF